MWAQHRVDILRESLHFNKFVVAKPGIHSDGGRVLTYLLTLRQPPNSKLMVVFCFPPPPSCLQLKEKFNEGYDDARNARTVGGRV